MITIDEAVRREISADVRLSSGVPEAHRGQALEALMMVGLLHPVLEEADPCEVDAPEAGPDTPAGLGDVPPPAAGYALLERASPAPGPYGESPAVARLSAAVAALERVVSRLGESAPEAPQAGAAPSIEPRGWADFPEAGEACAPMPVCKETPAPATQTARHRRPTFEEAMEYLRELQEQVDRPVSGDGSASAT